MSALPNEIASIFDYIDVINLGAYGLVYKVMKKSMNHLGNLKLYAMKIVISNPDVYNSLKNIEAELKILKELNNPYVVSLDSSFQIKDKVYMVIDYCPNGDLLKAVVDKKTEHQEFSEDEIWKYFIQSSFGLEALHSNGFIHRDIKPQNILLDENMNVKLADFGLSRYSEASSVAGTLPFYSPRMCSGDIPTKESDIWALGCVLYYLCNLEDPFQGNRKKIKNEPHMPIKSQYSKELRYFVDGCLKKKRNERPTINEIITHEFIVNKAINLGIIIPATSAMMSTIHRDLLNREREQNLNFASKLSESSLPIDQDFQENINSFHPITSLYLTKEENDRTKLIIYDTESERKEERFLDFPELLDNGTCITQLPNGELFCYGKSPSSGITLIIDRSYGFRILPSGIPCRNSSSIYFNDNVYCFGGNDNNDADLSLSRKFDLNSSRWINNLKPMAHPEFCCCCVIFNGNILVSGYYNRNILRYSVDRNAFSTIPYQFAAEKRKILINVGRLYLIECGYGFIYESEVGNDCAWKQISNSEVGDDYPYQIYCSYNKGGIYIGASYNWCFYKFDLSQNIMTELQ